MLAGELRQTKMSDIDIDLGDNGAGEHCDEQLMHYGGGAALGGKRLDAVRQRLFVSVR